MQKKVYLNELSYDEIMKKVHAGAKFYFDDNTNDYIQKKDGFLITFYEDGTFAIGDRMQPWKNLYILEEVDEPEADESCIGKLCKFWNNEDDSCFGFLGEIDREQEFPFANSFGYTGVGYKHCRPLSREEVEKFIKE